MNFSFIILFLLFIFNGCVKNTISIYVEPSGGFNMTINAHGMKDDILDNDFPLPENNQWNIISTIDSNDVDTYDVSAIKHFNPNEYIPENFHINKKNKVHPLLKHTINVNHSNWILYKKYSININFTSRIVDKKYPKFMKIINDLESPGHGWAEEILSYIFKETLNRTNIEFNQKAIIGKDLDTWILREISTKSDSLIIQSFYDLKEEGLDLIMHPLNPIFYTEIDSTFNYLQQEYEITKSLIDDEFEIRLYLPGKLKESNHQDNSMDTLIWNFTLKDFMDKDYSIYATSGIYYKGRTIVTIVLSLLVLIILLFRRQR